MGNGQSPRSQCHKALKNMERWWARQDSILRALDEGIPLFLINQLFDKMSLIKNEEKAGGVASWKDAKKSVVYRQPRAHFP